MRLVVEGFERWREHAAEEKRSRANDSTSDMRRPQDLTRPPALLASRSVQERVQALAQRLQNHACQLQVEIALLKDDLEAPLPPCVHREPNLAAAAGPAGLWQVPSVDWDRETRRWCLERAFEQGLAGKQPGLKGSQAPHISLSATEQVLGATPERPPARSEAHTCNVERFHSAAGTSWERTHVVPVTNSFKLMASVEQQNEDGGGGGCGGKGNVKQGDRLRFFLLNCELTRAGLTPLA